MQPRSEILALFSTFAFLEGDRFRRWIPDPRLQRSMQGRLAQNPDRSDRLWSIYWLKQWHSETSPLAESHLTAYLQEACYWAAEQIARRMQKTEYTEADYFQMASMEIRRVLKGFDLERGGSLQSYASMVLTNALKDTLRQRQTADICNDWALLRKWSKKRVKEVLDRVGIVEPEASQYVLAWFCFKTLSSPAESTGGQICNPDPSQWQQIADFYNTQRQSQLAVPGASLTPAQIEKRLTQLGKWLRDYLYPTMGSLNRPKPEEEGREVQDDLPDPTDSSLLDLAIEQEEVEQRTSERAKLQTVLTQALANLTPELQEILRLYHQQGLSQQQLAAHLNLSQPTASRRLKKAQEQLLATLLTWIESELNHFPEPNVLKSISMSLNEWLVAHYGNSDIN